VTARRRFPLHAGVASVAAVESVTPSMRRFTLKADAFADFGLDQPGEIITLGWPAPGRELVLPRAGWRFPPGNEDQHWLNFTVRSIDPERSVVDVDFFVHGDDDAAGRRGRRAGAAARTRPGLGRRRGDGHARGPRAPAQARPLPSGPRILEARQDAGLVSRRRVIRPPR
jgi:hypothetical protein